jgi:hypothetical protein
MPEHARRPSPWLTLFQRVAGLSVCLPVLQQCNRPPGSTGPVGPSAPPNDQPPTIPPPSSTFPATPQVFVGAGDIASCGPGGNAEPTARLLDTIGGTNHGVLKFVLQADSCQWEFITVGQGVADSGSGSCH